MALVMESVIRSAYMTTRRFTLRAARPMVWMSDDADRKKPSLSASRMATRATSGRSRPSRRRLIPTRTSIEPRRSSRRISMRGMVSMSECRYCKRTAEVLGQVLPHLFVEVGDEVPPAGGHRGPDAGQQVVHLPLGGPDGDLRVDQAGRADDLLDHLRRVLLLEGPRGSRDEHGLGHPLDEFVEAQRAVVPRRGKAEAVLDQHVLAGAIPGPLAVQLGHGDVALVDDDQIVLGEEVEQCEGRLAGGAAVEVAAVVLDARAHPGLGQHFEVVLGADPEALGLEQLALLLEVLQALPQLHLDGADGALHDLV